MKDSQQNLKFCTVLLQKENARIPEEAAVSLKNSFLQIQTVTHIYNKH